METRGPETTVADDDDGGGATATGTGTSTSTAARGAADADADADTTATPSGATAVMKLAGLVGLFLNFSIFRKARICNTYAEKIRSMQGE